MVSIVILNWNSIDFLKNLLESICKNINHNYEIIVIDNGSTDKSIEYLSNNYPDITLIENSNNKGVAYARNQGIEKAKGEYIFIIDVDTIVVNDVVSIMVNRMKEDKNIGIIGCRLLNFDKTIQFSCGEFPTILSKIAARTFLFKKTFKKYNLMDWDHSVSIDVGFVLGACQFIRRELLENVGYYDRNMFYGFEDIDLCVRAWKGNWKVIYEPEAVIIHKHQRITKKLFSKITLKHIQSLFIYLKKHKTYFTTKKVYDEILLDRKWKEKIKNK